LLMRIPRICFLALLLAVSAHAPAQALISDGSEPKNPIDVAFDKCEADWDGSKLSDWSACIARADEKWQREMDSTYRQLKDRFAGKELSLLVRSQKAWLEARAADRAFVESHPDLRAAYGAEGVVSYRRDLMLKTRARALELREFLEVFGSPSTQSNKSFKPNPLRGSA